MISRTCLLGTCCILLCTISYSQNRVEPGTIESENKPSHEVSPPNNTSTIADLMRELEGTFEVHYSISDYRILYTLELLETIKSSREEDGIAYLEWDEYTTIWIYPSNGTN